MAIKHVITLGLGFADGTKFIPTLGFTPGSALSAITELTFSMFVSPLLDAGMYVSPLVEADMEVTPLLDYQVDHGQ